MPRLASHIAHHASIKNIIFDFGGVICDLDISRTKEKFDSFGPPKVHDTAPEKEQSERFFRLVTAYETGSISSREFRETIRGHYLTPPGDELIDETWNACLTGIPGHRIRLLESIRNSYRIFLLSNSNEIHFQYYREHFLQPYGYQEFDELFERAWFSFRIGLVKPDPNIFEFVMHDKRLTPSETLFIDDTEDHVLSAIRTGMSGYHLKPGEDISALFS